MKTIWGISFVVFQLVMPNLAVAEQDCRAEIAKVICLVDATATLQNTMSRPCLEGGEKYASFFENLHDRYPKALQKMFCSLEKIFVENDADFSAYSNAIETPDGATHAVIGVRRSMLDSALDLSTWASWKEQISFGGNFNSYEPNAKLPMIHAETNSPGLLYFIITHEFGHLLDIANRLNTTENCHEVEGKDYLECDFAKGTWGSVGWLTDDTPRPENEFEHRVDICFYACNGIFAKTDWIQSVYSDFFEKTDFISLYAATQPGEDFADSLAFFIASKYILQNYVIQITDPVGGDKISFDITKKLQSDKFRKKREYLERLMERNDLIYPKK